MKLKRGTNRLCRGSTVLQTVDCSCGGGGGFADFCCPVLGTDPPKYPLHGVPANTQGNPAAVARLAVSGQIVVAYESITDPGKGYAVNEPLSFDSPINLSPFTTLARPCHTIQSISLPIYSRTVTAPGVPGSGAIGIAARQLSYDARQGNDRPIYVLSLSIVLPRIVNGAWESFELTFAGTRYTVSAFDAVFSTTVPSQITGQALFNSTGYPNGAEGVADIPVSGAGFLAGSSINATFVNEVINLLPCPPSPLLAPPPPDDPRATLTPERAFKGGCCGQ